MRRSVGIIVVGALMLSLAPPIHAQDKSPPVPAGTLVLDGAKNPELFPEWFKWERFFTSLVGAPLAGAVVHGLKLPPLHVQLGLSEGDLAIVLKEVTRFQTYRQVMETQVRDVIAAMKAQGKREDVMMAAVHQVDLVYRTHILEARQRLYGQLAPESLGAIVRDIDQRIQGTTMYLRGSAKDTFRLPW